MLAYEELTMRIIISPAKKMNVDTDSLSCQSLPVFIQQAELLANHLKAMSYADLKKIWKCNDKIAALNVQRLQNMNLRKNLTPAILAYEGIQYQYMAAGVFTDQEFAYVQEHLRIISGFYGILKPFDGVVPYRLEMQAKIRIGEVGNLYDYWGNLPATLLSQETDCIINLASKEYSTCISRYLPASVRLLTCIFGEELDGKIIEKGTMCKIARGEMVRFMAESQITNPEQIKTFDHLHYRFAPQYSNENKFVFTRNATKD